MGNPTALPESLRLACTYTATSGTAIGCPRELRRIPGRFAMSSAWSFGMLLRPGSTASTFSTLARSGRTLPIAARRAPTLMASMETSTPTAHVTPITVVHANPRRCSRPSRFMRRSIPSCLRKSMRCLLLFRQGIDDVQPCRAQAREAHADEGHEHGSQDAKNHDHHRHRESGDVLRRKGKRNPSQREARQRRGDTYQYRLGRDEEKHRPAAE